MARQAFGDFGDSLATRTLYFGCEPFFLKTGLASGGLAALEFGESVDAAEGLAVHL